MASRSRPAPRSPGAAEIPAAAFAPPSGALAIEWVPLSRIRRYDSNPRRNQPVEKVARLIESYGWTQPLVLNGQYIIIIGDTRFQACELRGWTHAPCFIARHLSPEQERALRLADNRSSEDAEWETGLLAGELRDLSISEIPLELTGFDPLELVKVLGVPDRPEPGVADASSVPPLPTEPVTRPGERLRLGRHVLVCGDATDPQAYERALEGRKVDLVWTDPPYGVAYEGKTKDRLVIANDELDETALAAFLRKSLRLAHHHSKPGAVWYVAAPHGPLFFPFAMVLRELRVWRQTLLWVKDSMVLCHSDFHYKHEPLLAGQVPALEDPSKDAATVIYGWVAGAAHKTPDQRNLTTVWECPRPKASRQHPTMKPVELIARQIEVSTTGAQALVLDPFAGSGSTLLAAECTGRSAVCLEIDPRYCDVIVSRWQEMAGGVPVTREPL